MGEGRRVGASAVSGAVPAGPIPGLDVVGAIFAGKVVAVEYEEGDDEAGEVAPVQGEAGDDEAASES